VLEEEVMFANVWTRHELVENKLVLLEAKAAANSWYAGELSDREALAKIVMCIENLWQAWGQEERRRKLEAAE